MFWTGREAGYGCDCTGWQEVRDHKYRAPGLKPIASNDIDDHRQLGLCHSHSSGLSPVEVEAERQAALAG